MNDASFSNHLANLRYSVCVRRESGYCSIDWSVGSSNQVRNPRDIYFWHMYFLGSGLCWIFLVVWASPHQHHRVGGHCEH